MNAAEPLLQFEHISRSFDAGRVPALRDVSLSMRAGEVVAILGRSGSGKSSLVNIASGIEQPDTGMIRWKGAPIVTRRAWAELRAREIGIVFQEFHLLPTLTALQNVELPMVGGGLGSAAQRKHAMAALEQVNLAARIGHLPAELSGGERQRVAIARALVCKPALLLADEPTGNLDSDNAARIAELMFALCTERRMTLLLVTHDEELGARCSRQVRLHDGRVVADSAMAEPVGDRAA